MDTVMPLGFFENTREIYAEVASYPVVPPEKIKQYWNVYTTTFRRLFDPSAFRLENFWWHVWGSHKLRNLSGPALARLFEEFSNGPTFVPLSSPANRLIRSKPPAPARIPNASSSIEVPHPPLEGPDQESAAGDNRKGLTPSSSRPPPAHPILKKSRGPSASGRRPTARFVSPPSSGDEAVDDDEAETASTAVSSSEMPPPPLPPSVRQNQKPAPSGAQPASSPATMSSTPETEPKQTLMLPPTRGDKSAPSTGRRVVAATAASRRRPVMVRRPSSQSSAGSDSGGRVAGFVTAARRSSSKRQTPTASQLLGPGSASPQTAGPELSAKAAGKRPAKSAASSQSVPASVPAQPTGQLKDAAVLQQQAQLLGPQRRSTWDIRDSVASQDGQVRQAALPRPTPPPVAGFVADQTSGHAAAPPMVRSRSKKTEGLPRLGETGVALVPTSVTSSVATFTTTARGQFDSEPVTTAPVVPEARDIPDSVLYASQPSASSLDLRYKPTPPNPAPPVPFGRSRSELNLLLERAKPRDKPRRNEGS